MDARFSRIVHQVLLIAMAIQGLTPDFRSLSSTLLLRMLTCEFADLASDKGSESLPVEDHRADSSEVFTPGGMQNSLRLHRDTLGRLIAEFTPISPCERLFRSAIVQFHPLLLALQWDDDLIRSLSRLLC